MPGVVEVITHENRPHLPWLRPAATPTRSPVPGSPFRGAVRRRDPVQRAADRARRGRDAGGRALRRVAGRSRVRDRAAQHRLRTPSCRRSSSRRRSATRSSRRRIAATPTPRSTPRRCSFTGVYHEGTHHHNPMEMHATTVVWEGDGTHHGPRQDAGLAERRRTISRRCSASRAGRRSRAESVRRRRLRLGPAAAVPGLPRDAGGEDARALGARRDDAPADVQPRPSSRGAADGVARRPTQTGRLQAIRNDATTVDLALRGLHGGGRQLGPDELRVRQRVGRVHAAPRSTPTRRATCARRAPRPA